MVDPNKDKFIYGAIKLEEELDIHFPPMGPNFDVKCLSIRCHRAPPPSSSPLTPIKKKGLLSGKMKLSRSLSGGEKLPKDHVIVDVRLVIGPNKLRIPLHEEGNLDLKGEFKFKFKIMPDNGFRFLSMKMGKIKHRPGPKSTKYSATIMSMAQKMSTLSGVLPEWNLTNEMQKAKEGVPLNLSEIFLTTPMEYVMGMRGLVAANMHQYFKFSPMYDGTVLKFAFFVGPQGGSMDHIILEALPVEAFKEDEIIKVYAQEEALNDFLATTVFDIQKPMWRAVSTQIQITRQPNDKTTIDFYGFFRKAILFEDGDDIVTEINDQLAIKRLVDCHAGDKPFSVLRAPTPKSIHVDERGVETEREGDIPGITKLVPDFEKATKEVTRRVARRQLMEVWSEWLDQILDNPFSEIDRDPLQRLVHKILRKVMKVEDVGWDGPLLKACLKVKEGCRGGRQQSTETTSSLPVFPASSSSSSSSSSKKKGTTSSPHI